VTTVYIAPGDRQVIGGQGAVVKTCGPNFDRLILREPASIDMAIGDPPKAALGESAKSPVTRMSIAALIRKSLIDAQEYDRSQKAYDAKPEEEKKKSPRPPRDLGNESPGQASQPGNPGADRVRPAGRPADGHSDRRGIQFQLGHRFRAHGLSPKGRAGQEKDPGRPRPTSHRLSAAGR